MDIKNFKSLLDKRPDLQHLLFRRGFYVSKNAINELDRKLYDMNIRVVNMAETANRARALNMIFNINRILP